MHVRLSFLALPFSLACGVAWGWRGYGEPEVRFLAVGQGDCIVYRDSGRTILIDAGPKNPFVDAGERTVVPSLRALGVGSIDVLVLTHPDADHFGGLPAIAKKVAIHRVMVSSEFRGRPEILSSLKGAGIDSSAVFWLPQRYAFSFGSTRAEIFCPKLDPGEDDNAGSVILRVAARGGSVLLTGDAGFSAEDEEMRSLIPLQSSILKAGHHGSATSTSAEYLKAVQPRFVVVSCGRNNKFGHPAPSLLSRVERNGAEILRTDRQGTVGFRFTESGVELLPSERRWR